jgi:RNA polymerase sigma-70 factor, ECF subfamily
VSTVPNELFADAQVDFAGVASRCSTLLFRVALRSLRNVEDAEDAVQDALLSAYKHIGSFEGRAQLSTWLTKIVMNVARMKLRSRPRQEIVSLDETLRGSETTLASELADPGPNPESYCAHAEMEETLRTALDRISPKLRIAFQMREFSGYSVRETADSLGISTSAVKSRVNRARAAIVGHLHLVKTSRLADSAGASRSGNV